MVEKPIEWRRFERVELEGEVAHAAPKTTGVTHANNPPSLLREFERVLRENERLHLELSTLRAEAVRNGDGTSRFRTELESARAELAQLEEESSSASVPSPVVASVAKPSGEGEQAAAPTSDALPAVAEIVAGYLFANPNEANVRLVQDALRSRGVGSLLSDGRLDG